MCFLNQNSELFLSYLTLHTSITHTVQVSPLPYGMLTKVTSSLPHLWQEVKSILLSLNWSWPSDWLWPIEWVTFNVLSENSTTQIHELIIYPFFPPRYYRQQLHYLFCQYTPWVLFPPVSKTSFLLSFLPSPTVSLRPLQFPLATSLKTNATHLFFCHAAPYFQFCFNYLLLRNKPP